MIIGWLARLVISLALVGMLAFDGISIATARAHVNDVASDVADATAARYVQNFSAPEALDAAEAKVVSEGATLAKPNGVVITRVGHVVTITVTVDLVPGTALLGHLPGTGQLDQTTATAVRRVKQ